MTGGMLTSRQLMAAMMAKDQSGNDGVARLRRTVHCIAGHGAVSAEHSGNRPIQHAEELPDGSVAVTMVLNWNDTDDPRAASSVRAAAVSAVGAASAQRAASRAASAHRGTPTAPPSPWTARFRMTVDGQPSFIANIDRFAAAVEQGSALACDVGNGRVVPVTHSMRMFDAASQPLVRIMLAIARAHRAAWNTLHDHARPIPQGFRAVELSAAQLVELLDHAPDHACQLVTDESFDERTIAVTAHAPDLGVQFERVDTGTAHGYQVNMSRHIVTSIMGAEHDDDNYLLVADGTEADATLTFHRVPSVLADAAATLELVDGAFLSDRDVALFDRTLLADLSNPALHIAMPTALTESSTDRAHARFHVSVDDDTHSLQCRAVASYAAHDGTAHEFNVFDETVTDGAGTGIVRDMRMEQLMRETVLLFMKAPDRDHGEPYARLGDGIRVRELLFTGLKALAVVGDVFATDRVDRLMHREPVRISVRTGMSGSILRLNVTSTDIPANEISAVLDSYRRRKRYHRLKDGSFIDLKNTNLDEFDDFTQRYAISMTALDRGNVTMPLFRAFVLADEGIVEPDGELTAFIDGLRHIDPNAYALPDGLHAQLRPYQKTGYEWLSILADKGFGGILADEMGLGKTLQMIAWMQYRYRHPSDAERDEETCRPLPSLVICPASLVYNWSSEIERFSSLLTPIVVESSDQWRTVREQAGRECVVAIVSYDLLRRSIDEADAIDWLAVVADEAQMIKNPATQNAHAVKRLVATHRFALTGTPIENRPAELWSIVDFVMPGYLGSQQQFRTRYERPITDGDTNAAQQLNRMMAPFILRRLKSQVLTDLPEKIEQVVSVPMGPQQQELYTANEAQLAQFIEHADSMNTIGIQVLAELTVLREICCDPSIVYEDYTGESAKLDAIADLVQSNVDEGRKVLIFSQFVRFLDDIARRLGLLHVDTYEITGQTDKRERLDLVNAFNDPDNTVPVMLISLKAGGTGLNLTAASSVILADPWWNEAAQQQATDRAHRIGQRHRVHVFQVVTRHTIEERIVELQQRKSRIASMLLDSPAQQGTTTVNGLASLSKDDLLALLRN